jgi:hypothetical protein
MNLFILKISSKLYLMSKYFTYIEGHQNMSLQNRPFWFNDYIELRAIENQQI